MLKEKLGVTLEELNTECGFFQFGEKSAQKSEQKCLSQKFKRKTRRRNVFRYMQHLCIQNIASNLRNFREGRSGNCV